MRNPGGFTREDAIDFAVLLGFWAVAIIVACLIG